MKSIGPLVPLLMAAGILLAGNGLQGTLIALRAGEEGFDATLVGLMGTAYFIGFIVSCLICPRLLRAVGHIRVFAALASFATAGALLLVLWLDPYVWVIIRFSMGFCFAGLFMTVESWLNESTPNESRGQVMSLYRIMDLAVVTGSQFMIPFFGTSGFVLFAIMAMMFCLSMVPVSLADRSNPKPPDAFKFDLKVIWAISPLACLGCITIGMTNSAFRLIGPLFARDVGFDATGVAFFMSAGIVGGAVLQYPLGWASDHFDRRWVLIVATIGAAASGLFMSQFAGTSPLLLNAGMFIFGAFSLPLYSLSAAHANDRASKGQFVLVAAGLSFFFSLGAAIGPVVVAYVMKTFGTPAFFTYTCVVHSIFVIVTLWRMTRRARPEAHKRGRFTSLLRTSPVFYRMARRAVRQRLHH